MGGADREEEEDYEDEDEDEEVKKRNDLDGRSVWKYSRG